MKKISDQGIIISTRKYSESSLIIKILSKEYGIYSGLVKGALGNKNSSSYQIGNLVDFNWSAKHSDNLGYFKVELVKSYLAKIISSPIILNGVSSINYLIEKNIFERDPNLDLFKELLDFLDGISDMQNEFLSNYIHLEIKLLQIFGYGIDLSCCVVTNSVQNLCFVSPKSAKAVSKDIGEPYRDRLLKLPQFLVEKSKNSKISNLEVSKSDILDGLKLSDFFMNKYLCMDGNFKIPNSRHRMVSYVRDCC